MNQDTPINTNLEKVQRLARAIRRASVLPFTAPIGLILGYCYIEAIGHLDERPRDHRGTMVTIYEDLALTLVFAAVTWWLWPGA
ncbi:MAG: hypothetical protein RL885_07855 [Planctomycetota bacterium]